MALKVLAASAALWNLRSVVGRTCGAGDDSCGVEAETESMRSSLLQKQVMPHHAVPNFEKRRDEILEELETIEAALKASSHECMGDYGSKVGDPACCGQGDITSINSEEHICPKSHPKCEGFFEGEHYGYCVKASSYECMGDYGRKVGDPACCGQGDKTSINSEEHICPAFWPTCEGFVEGEHYGHCVKGPGVGDKVRIRNLFNQHCMSARKDGILEINDCAGKDSVFKFTKSGHIKHVETGKCVGKSNNVIELILEKCEDDVADQLFALRDKKFHALKDSLMCIDVEGLYQTHIGKPLLMSPCSVFDTLSDQLWELIKK